MKITIRDFRGLAKADLEINGNEIVILGGYNASGKSSAVQAVRETITGQRSGELLVKEFAALVRSGGGPASCKVESDTGWARVTYPDGKHSSDGMPPQSTAIGAGMTSLIDMETKVRAWELQQLLKATPTRKDLEDYLKKRNIAKEQIDAACRQIWKDEKDRGDWDKAQKNFESRRTELTGKWCQITGKRQWGTKEGAEYLPAGWEHDLDGVSEESLRQAVADAEAALETLLKVEAVNEQELADLQEKAAAVFDLQEELKLAKDDADEAQKDWNEAEQAYRSAIENIKRLPRPDKTQSTTPCPHCGEEVVIEATLPSGKPVLAKPRERNETEIQGMLDTIKLAQEAADAQAEYVKELAVKNQEAQQEHTRIALELKSAESAKKRFDELAQQAQQKPADAKVIEKQRTAVQRARTRLEAFRKKVEADAADTSIRQTIEIVEALRPDGVRAQKNLPSALIKFNEQCLQPLCEAADWKNVEIDSDLLITYGNRPVRFCSASEQFRARVVLQVAVAMLDGSELIVIDAADILDADGRGELLMLLQEAELPALVTMTLKAVEVPDLEKAELGRTYWIADGVAQPLQAVLA